MKLQEVIEEVIKGKGNVYATATNTNLSYEEVRIQYINEFPLSKIHIVGKNKSNKNNPLWVEWYGVSAIPLDIDWSLKVSDKVK